MSSPDLYAWATHGAGLRQTGSSARFMNDGRDPAIGTSRAAEVLEEHNKLKKNYCCNKQIVKSSD